MENTALLGTVKIRIVRGIDLAIRDFRSSDPYVILSMGDQKFRTRTIRSNCNPQWDEEFTFLVSDPTIPIKLEVYDYDTFSRDDEMGEAEIDVVPYLECVEFGLEDLPLGTAVKKVQPSTWENDLAEESKVVWMGNGGNNMLQDMVLKLKNVEKGELQVQIIEWIKLDRGSSRKYKSFA